MRYLILESIAAKPHLETAGEIGLDLRGSGADVRFAWIGGNLPWTEWCLDRYSHGLPITSERRRVREFTSLLEANGIETFESDGDTTADRVAASSWAQKFEGDLSELKRYEFQGQSLGLGVASSLISVTKDSKYKPEHDLARVRLALSGAVLVYQRALNALSKLRPDIVITFNGRFSISRPIVLAARQVGCKVLLHERGSIFNKYELYERSPHDLFYIRERIAQAWESADKDTRAQIGHEFFRRKRSGDGFAWLSYIEQQRPGHIPKKVEGTRRVVYFSSSDDEMAAVEFETNSTDGWASQLDAANALILAASSCGIKEIIFRLHPHLALKSKQDRDRWMSLGGPGVVVVAPDSPVDSYALVDSADVVVSYGSTVGIEAAYSGKLSLALCESTYSDSPAVVRCNSIEDLKVYLSPSKRQSTPCGDACLPFGYYYATYGRVFRFYRAESLFDGTLLGRELTGEPWYVRAYRATRDKVRLSRIAGVQIKN